MNFILKNKAILMQLLSTVNQRWSRERKARSQGKEQKKNPRPRTAFLKTDPLEAKDRNARDQGQGNRRKCSQKKKGLL